MTEREKVIKGLECCLKDDCDNCPYYDPEVDHDCDCFGKCLRGNMYHDALALLKAQEPRVTCSVCKYSRCLSGEWFCFMIGTSRYGKRVTDGDWYCKDAIGR